MKKFFKNCMKVFELDAQIAMVLALANINKNF